MLIEKIKLALRVSAFVVLIILCSPLYLTLVLGEKLYALIKK